jgi:hypothetical protein
MTINSTSISEKELSSRWAKTSETLRQLRKAGRTPRFFKVGASVRYLLSEVEKFEHNLGN